MAPSLGALPEELLEGICEHFESIEQWATLRLTSRKLQRTTRRKWATKHFRVFDKSFDKTGISRLLAISEVPDLASEVIAVKFNCPDVNSNLLQHRKTLVECSQILVLVFRNLTAVYCIRFGALTLDDHEEDNEEGFRLIDISAIFEAVMFAARLSKNQIQGLYVPVMGEEEGRVGLPDYSILRTPHQPVLEWKLSSGMYLLSAQPGTKAKLCLVCRSGRVSAKLAATCWCATT